MQNILSRYHTWHLIRVILLRANSQYHSGGISAGRSPMSYIYDAWESVFPYTGPQLMNIPFEDLAKELRRRPPLIIRGQMVFKQFGLQALTFEEITVLVVNAMERGHFYMEKHCGWEGLSQSYRAVKTVKRFLGRVPRHQSYYLPTHVFKKKVTSPAQYQHLKRIVEDLETRIDQIYVDPTKGIVKADKQPPFFFR